MNQKQCRSDLRIGLTCAILVLLIATILPWRLGLAQERDVPNIDLILLIDNSGSMMGVKCPNTPIQATDPDELRVLASRFFVGYMAVNSTINNPRVGVIAFGIEPKRYSPIDTPGQRVRDAIRAQNLCATDLIPALERAYDEFKTNNSFYSTNRRPVVVLLTDAALDEYPESKYKDSDQYLSKLEEQLDALRHGGPGDDKPIHPATIYAITINAKPADQEVWRTRLLSGANDRYFSLDGVSELVKSLHDIAAIILGYQSGMPQDFGVGETKELWVPPYLHRLTFSILKTSDKDVSVEIRRPNDEKLAPADKDVMHFGGGTGDLDEFYAIERPAPGRWTIKITGGPGHSVRIWQDTLPFRLEVKNADMLRSSQEPLILTVKIADDSPDRGGQPAKLESAYPIRVTTEVVGRDGQIHKKTTETSQRPGEAVYELRYDQPFAPGEYQVRLAAEWKDQDGYHILITKQAEFLVSLAAFPSIVSVEVSPDLIGIDQPVHVLAKTKDGNLAENMVVKARVFDQDGAMRQEIELAREGADIFTGNLGGFPTGIYTVTAFASGQVTIPPLAGDQDKIIDFGLDGQVNRSASFWVAEVPDVRVISLAFQPENPDSVTSLTAQAMLRDWDRVQDLRVSLSITNHEGNNVRAVEMTSTGGGQFVGAVGSLGAGTYTATAHFSGTVAVRDVSGATVVRPINTDNSRDLSLSLVVRPWWLEQWAPFIIGTLILGLVAGIFVKRTFFPTPKVFGTLEIIEPDQKKGIKYRLGDFKKPKVTIGASGDIALDGDATMQGIEARFVGRREGRRTNVPPYIVSAGHEQPVMVDSAPVDEKTGFLLSEDLPHEIRIGNYRLRYTY